MQVAKSMQMTMGLHDDDVSFFLAADTRELYQEVRCSQVTLLAHRYTAPDCIAMSVHV